MQKELHVERIRYFLFPDYLRHKRDPDKFFITDLAIVSIPNSEFTFTERVIPVCLAYNSHRGYDLRFLGYKISGKTKEICLNLFQVAVQFYVGWGDYQSQADGEIQHFSNLILKAAQIRIVDFGQCFLKYKVSFTFSLKISISSYHHLT